MSDRPAADRPTAGRPAADQPAAGPAAGDPPRPASGATLARALPGISVLLLVDAAAVWAAFTYPWAPLAVVLVCVIDGLADGVFAWLRARASFAAGAATDKRDAVLVREFLRTYLVVIGVQVVVAYMVFSGTLLKPGGEAPVDPAAGLATGRFWAVVAGLAAVRALLYWWDFMRGGEASVIPPEAVVAEPLRRLFVLQFGVLAGALVVYWLFDSSATALAVLLVLKALADLLLAVFERLRAARIAAAVAAGVAPAGRVMPRQRAPRGGRKRRR